MSVKRKAKVVMLPANEKANNAVKGYLDGSLLFYYQKEYKTIEAEKGFTGYYHLYILSDDGIKEGDYGFIYIGKYGTIGKVSYDGKYNTWDLTTSDDVHYPFSSKEAIKKVIATTDSFLSPKIHKGEVVDGSYPKEFRDAILPQPSQSFIQKFIEAYNSGNPIADVLVEYESIKELTRITMTPYVVGIQPKVSKDNTITITKVKDSWSREEVHNLMMQAWITGEASPNQHYTVREKWIKENL